MHHHKKLYLCLALLIATSIVFLWYQIHKATDIHTSQDTSPLIASYPTDIPLDGTEPTLGTPGADIQIIEFNDVSCKDCLATHVLIENFINNHPGQLELIWKNTTKNSFFTASDVPSAAALCAHEQRAFWDFLHASLGKYKRIPEDINQLQNLATETKLKSDVWNTCLASEATKQKILTSKTTSRDLKILSAPTLFINNKQIFLTPEINITDLLTSLTSQ